MLRRLGPAILLLTASCFAQNLASFNGWCEDGGQSAVFQGIPSTNFVQISAPGCQVAVYFTGTASLVPLFSNNNLPPTPLSNPFISSSLNGQFLFCALPLIGYDITVTSSLLPAPVTMTDVILNATVAQAAQPGYYQVTNSTAGANWGAKVATALASAVCAAGCTVDTTPLIGVQSAPSGVIVSISPVKLLVGEATISFGAPLVVNNQFHMSGVSKFSSVILQSSNGYNLIQNCTGSDAACFAASSLIDLQFDNLTIQGVGSGGTGGGGSNGYQDNAFLFAHISRLSFEHMRLTGLQGNGLFLQDVTDLTVGPDFTVDGINSSGFRATGINHGELNGVVIRDTALLPSAFNIAIEFYLALPGGGSLWPHNSNITLNGVQVYNYPDAQALIFHEGSDITVNGFVGNNILDCIAVAPFASPDLASDITINGPTCIGTTTPGASNSANQTGIAVLGYNNSTGIVKNVTVTGANVDGFNQIGQQVNYGGISCSNADGLQVTGSNITNTYANGFVVSSYCTGFNFTGNRIKNILAVAGQQFGVWAAGTASSSTGQVQGNILDTMLDCYRADSAEIGILVYRQPCLNVSGGVVVNPANLSMVSAILGSGQVSLSGGAATVHFLLADTTSTVQGFCADLTTPANSCALTITGVGTGTIAGTGADTVNWQAIGY